MRSVAVIGMGRFGAALVRELEQLGVEVLAIDTDEKDLQKIRADVSAARVIDGRDDKALASAGAGEVDMAVVAIGESFEAAQECVLALRKLGVSHIVARAQTADRRTILQKIGADRVVSPEVESAKRVAQSLAHPLMADSVDIGDGASVATLEVPEALVGKTLAEIGRERLQGLLVLRVLRKNGPKPEVIMPPGAETRLEAGDQITIVGQVETVRAFCDA